MERSSRSNRSGVHPTRSMIPKTKGIKHERESSTTFTKTDKTEIVHKDFFNGMY